MHLPRFEYARAESVTHVATLLGELRQRAAVLAGGTDLLATMWQRLATPEFVIGIRGLAELQGLIFDADGSVTIGAVTTLSTLTDDGELGRRFPMLQKAFHAVASRHVRNMATLGATSRCRPAAGTRTRPPSGVKRAPPASRPTTPAAMCSPSRTTASPPAVPTACQR